MADHADIQKHVRTYMMVFAALAVLTIITVAISYLHMPFAAGVTVAMFVAIIKGGLVAGFFMHLISEKKAIYWLLYLTIAFFIMLMIVPTVWHGMDISPKEPGLDDVGTHHAAEGSH